MRYIGWIKKNLANTKQNVRGIIITKERDEKLAYAVSAVKDMIQVKYYKMTFNLSDCTREIFLARLVDLNPFGC